MPPMYASSFPNVLHQDPSSLLSSSSVAVYQAGGGVPYRTSFALPLSEKEGPGRFKEIGRKWIIVYGVRMSDGATSSVVWSLGRKDEGWACQHKLEIARYVCMKKLTPRKLLPLLLPAWPAEAILVSLISRLTLLPDYQQGPGPILTLTQTPFFGRSQPFASERLVPLSSSIIALTSSIFFVPSLERARTEWRWLARRMASSSRFQKLCRTW